ncbi:MAG: hypothetical protein K6T31_02130, partial [Alicyclobacillus sp.]|nr:hypothetical protein [Alicyclobacillus sp.]
MDQRVRWRFGLEQLFPGYFAAVMATGIVSIALWMNHYAAMSNLLFYVALVVYAVLIVLYSARVVWYPGRVWADLSHRFVVSAAERP